MPSLKAPSTQKHFQAASVYDGQRRLGSLIGRDDHTVEAFDLDGVSLGIFPNFRRAAAAINEHDRARP
jgi:hypothetical protein